MTTPHAVSNLEKAKDLAPEYGMSEMGEARFLRQELGAERIGISHYRMSPGRRVGFGHRHGESEEIYVVLAGAGRFKIDDAIVDVAGKDAIYCPPSSMREWEAGPDGLEILAFGGHAEEDAEMQPGWWTDGSP
jgi:mannose-6-phosphate isomerase-like protein (cupin superfamily)